MPFVYTKDECNSALNFEIAILPDEDSLYDSLKFIMTEIINDLENSTAKFDFFLFSFYTVRFTLTVSDGSTVCMDRYISFNFNKDTLLGLKKFLLLEINTVRSRVDLTKHVVGLNVEFNLIIKVNI